MFFNKYCACCVCMNKTLFLESDKVLKFFKRGGGEFHHKALYTRLGKVSLDSIRAL